MDKLRKTIVFLSINYRIENSTFLIAIPRILNQKGFNTLIITNTDFDKSNYQKDYISVLSLNNKNKIEINEIKKNENGIIKRFKNLKFLKNLKIYFYLYKKEIIKIKEYGLYSKIVGDYLIENSINVQKICVIDPESLFVAYKINKKYRYDFDFIYNSMELSFWDIKRPLLIKNYFNYLFKKQIDICKLITLQDNDRKKFFQSKVNTKIEIEILPVGIDGEINTTKSDFLRNTFKINPNQTIVLYSGSITPWACVYEIVENALKWKDDKCLVVNGWISNDDYFEKIKQISFKSKNIYINTKPVKWEDLDNLIISADIGLAIYRDTDLNTQAIASSSNKLGVYSKSGVPLIINNTFSIKKMFEDLKWGEGLDNLNDLEEKINLITQNQKRYSEKAYIAFDKYYNLNSLSQSFIKKITN